MQVHTHTHQTLWSPTKDCLPDAIIPLRPSRLISQFLWFFVLFGFVFFLFYTLYFTNSLNVPSIITSLRCSVAKCGRHSLLRDAQECCSLCRGLCCPLCSLRHVWLSMYLFHFVLSFFLRKHRRCASLKFGSGSML